MEHSLIPFLLLLILVGGNVALTRDDVRLPFIDEFSCVSVCQLIGRSVHWSVSWSVRQSVGKGGDVATMQQL